MEDFVIPRPEPSEYAPFYAGYVEKVPDGPFLVNLRESGEALITILRGLNREAWDYRYRQGKWNVREVVQHLIDTERVMAYRLLRLSRGDDTPLPGFDQDDFIQAARVNPRRPQSFIDEFAAVRESSLYLIGALQPDQFTLAGQASGQPVTVRALAYILAGHLYHHLELLKAHYLKA